MPSRKGVARLADEQAALRRVATLVAEGAAPGELFAAVADEVAAVIGVSSASVSRFLPDGFSVVLASLNDPGFPIGSRWRPDEGTLNANILATGQPVRIDQSAMSGPIAEASRVSDVRSVVGVPIVVEGSVWGMVAVGRQHSDDPLPADTEVRLTDFTELIATAIANAQARDDVVRLADEQAALRRVATLVAQGAEPAEMFAAVSAEVDRLFFSDPDTSDVAGVVRFEPGPELVAVGVSKTLDAVPLGSRWEPDDLLAPTRVLRTGRSARVDKDDLDSVGGPVAEFLRDHGYLTQVASPIVADGRVWGAVSVNSGDDLPPDTEERLEKFTELVATAIANAESNEALAELAEEQAALRRVATLVARDVPSAEVFDAVATEVAKLFDTEITIVGRYDGDGFATAIGNWSASPGGVPVGTRSILGGRNVLTIVAETGKPARVDGYDDASGEAADIARRHGWRSSIAAPIIVEGRVWGVMLVATQRSEPFPAGAEDRLAAFTDLVATALANAESHEALAKLADEQSALRRVATRVAQGVPPAELFSAVTREVARLFGDGEPPLVASVIRFDAGPEGVLVGASREYELEPIGSRWTPNDLYVSTRVLRTGSPARVDEQDLDSVGGPVAAVLRLRGFLYQVGSPVVVEGRLWGAMTLNSREPLPPDTDEGLRSFTELVATAIANAQSRAEVDRLAGEQAALRRVATLVAQGLEPEEIFAAVSDEIGAMFGSIAAVQRFEHDGAAVVFVGISKGVDTVPIGTRWEFVDGMASAEVYRTGRPARVDGADWSGRAGPVAEAGALHRIVSQVGAPIIVDGNLWGAVSVNAQQQLPPDTEQRLERFTGLVATAIANAESSAELAASRRRIVAAADEARRRIERDLHDGIQQRLVELTFRARALSRRPPAELQSLAAELAEGLDDVSDELREVSRGIHPTILTEAGLEPALRALARRSSVPIEVDISLDGRLPQPVEVAAYYVASEALTNVAKHAQASVVELVAAQDDGVLTLEIHDNGIGGAEVGRGSGIVGLEDRIEALGGTVSVVSPPRGGTTLSVHLPITT
jgi:GAF domain-containing protein